MAMRSAVVMLKSLKSRPPAWLDHDAGDQRGANDADSDQGTRSGLGFVSAESGWEGARAVLRTSGRKIG